MFLVVWKNVAHELRCSYGNKAASRSWRGNCSAQMRFLICGIRVQLLYLFADGFSQFQMNEGRPIIHLSMYLYFTNNSTVRFVSCSTYKEDAWRHVVQRLYGHMSTILTLPGYIGVVLDLIVVWCGILFNLASAEWYSDVCWHAV